MQADIRLGSGNSFAGPITVVLFPDRWKPKDGKPVTVTASRPADFATRYGGDAALACQC